jgi:hypothetical protein
MVHGTVFPTQLIETKDTVSMDTEGSLHSLHRSQVCWLPYTYHSNQTSQSVNYSTFSSSYSDSVYISNKLYISYHCLTNFWKCLLLLPAWRSHIPNKHSAVKCLERSHTWLTKQATVMRIPYVGPVLRNHPVQILTALLTNSVSHGWHDSITEVAYF